MKYLITLFLLLFSLTAGARAPNHIELKEPAVDWDIVDRIWVYILKELQAPPDLQPIPLVLDWKVPGQGQMAYTYPTKDFPDQKHQISLSPHILESGSREVVLWGIGHELTHYVMLMKENDYNTSQIVFVNNRKHHCDKEFIRITRGIAEIVHNSFHDEARRHEMYQEVLKACRLTPDQ